MWPRDSRFQCPREGGELGGGINGEVKSYDTYGGKYRKLWSRCFGNYSRFDFYCCTPFRLFSVYTGGEFLPWLFRWWKEKMELEEEKSGAPKAHSFVCAAAFPNCPSPAAGILLSFSHHRLCTLPSPRYPAAGLRKRKGKQEVHSRMNLDKEGSWMGGGCSGSRSLVYGRGGGENSADRSFGLGCAF